MALPKVVKKLTLKECHETHTDHNLSIAFKLALVLFINSAVVPTIVYLEYHRWFKQGGLVSVYFSIMVSISFTSPISYALSPDIIMRRLKKWYYKRQGKECMLTQAEANE